MTRIHSHGHVSRVNHFNNTFRPPKHTHRHQPFHQDRPTRDPFYSHHCVTAPPMKMASSVEKLVQSLAARENPYQAYDSCIEIAAIQPGRVDIFRFSKEAWLPASVSAADKVFNTVMGNVDLKARSKEELKNVYRSILEAELLEVLNALKGSI